MGDRLPGAGTAAGAVVGGRTSPLGRCSHHHLRGMVKPRGKAAPGSPGPHCFSSSGAVGPRPAWRGGRAAFCAVYPGCTLCQEQGHTRVTSLLAETSTALGPAGSAGAVLSPQAAGTELPFGCWLRRGVRAHGQRWLSLPAPTAGSARGMGSGRVNAGSSCFAAASAALPAAASWPRSRAR